MRIAVIGRRTALLVAALAIAASAATTPTAPEPSPALMFAVTPHSVTISFTEATYTCSGTRGVSIYKAPGTLTSPGTFLAITTSAISPYVDLNVSAGQQFVYYATSTCTSMTPSESGPSNRVAVTIPLDSGPPPAPTITVTTATLRNTRQHSYFNAALRAAPRSPVSFQLYGNNGRLLYKGTDTASVISGRFDIFWAGPRQRQVRLEACVARDNCVTQVVR